MFKLSRKDIKITKAAFRRKYYLMVIIFDLRYFYTTGAGEPGRGKLNKTRTRYKKGIREGARSWTRDSGTRREQEKGQEQERKILEANY